MNFFAVIDTETNWHNEVMSIGAVIAERDTFKKVDDLYFVFDPEYTVGGMFSYVLPVNGRKTKEIYLSRNKSMEKIKATFEKYQVKNLFAYNASFDKRLLNELVSYEWFDIMKIAANKQYNDKIPDNVECWRTGRMKRNYNANAMMQLLSGICDYAEVHNALYDAADELEIMKLIGKSLDIYECAKI